MTQHNCKLYLLLFMYDIVDNPSTETFYELYKTNPEEVKDFIDSSNNSILIHWLEVIFQKISTPGEFASIRYFSKHINKGIQDSYVLPNNDYIGNLTDEQEQDLLSGSIAWKSKKKIPLKSPSEEKKKGAKKTPSEEKKFKAKKKRKKRVSIVIKKTPSPPPFPSKARISNALKNAFTCSCQGNNDYSIRSLQENLLILIPEVNININAERIIFYDHKEKERDRFDVPEDINLK